MKSHAAFVIFSLTELPSSLLLNCNVKHFHRTDWYVGALVLHISDNKRLKINIYCTFRRRWRLFSRNSGSDSSIFGTFASCRA